MGKFFLTFLFVTSVALNSAVFPEAKVQKDALAEKQLDPVQDKQALSEAYSDEDRGDREKRLGKLKKIALKAGLLNLIFGKSTNRPPVEFETDSPISLVIPDELYATSFTLVTNASKIISNVIYNAADRAQELAERINWNLKHKFGHGKNVIEIGGDSKS